MSTVKSESELEQGFPPDSYDWIPEWFSFTRALSVIVVLLAVRDFTNVGLWETQFPYDYPFFLGVTYLLLLLHMLPRVHHLLDEVKIELVGIVERTGSDDSVFERNTDVTAEEIREEFECATKWAFHPGLLVTGALLSGLITFGIMDNFEVLDAYPHTLTTFAYGAGHGLFYAPIGGTAWLVWRISRDWIVDIDFLDPDGMGGYRQVGDAIVSLIIYVITFVTIDFFIISSVSYLDNAPFQDVALYMYFGMLLFYGLFVIGSTHLIRKRLLGIRGDRSNEMRRRFRDMQQRYWNKLENEENTSAEAEHIQTMQVLFSRLHQMDLWPINLWSLFRLAFSTTVSILLVALQEGWIQPPW